MFGINLYVVISFLVFQKLMLLQNRAITRYPNSFSPKQKARGNIMGWIGQGLTVLLLIYFGYEYIWWVPLVLL